MARLKVGDILIEDGRISFGSEEGCPEHRPRHVEGASSSSGDDLFLRLLLKLRVPLWAFLLVGGAIAAAGFVLLYSQWELLGPLAIPPVSLGLGIVALGFVKHHLARDRLRRAFERICAAVPGRDESNTIEFIAARSGLSEEEVVRTLAHFQKTGQVKEELNLRTGEWFYWPTAGEAAEKGFLSLADRLRDIERRK